MSQMSILGGGIPDAGIFDGITDGIPDCRLDDGFGILLAGAGIVGFCGSILGFNLSFINFALIGGCYLQDFFLMIFWTFDIVWFFLFF